MSADNIFQQRHTEESVYDVDHLPYSLLYEQPQAPVQSSHTVHPYGPVNQQTQYQFVSQGAPRLCSTCFSSRTAAAAGSYVAACCRGLTA